MTLAIGFAIWAVLSFPIALYAGPRLRSLTTTLPACGCKAHQTCNCGEAT
jgi:hypothetical protein